MKNRGCNEFVSQIAFVQRHLTKEVGTQINYCDYTPTQKLVSPQQQISSQKLTQLLMGVCTLYTQTSKYTQRPINKIKILKIFLPKLVEKQHAEKYVFNSSPHTQSC